MSSAKKIKDALFSFLKKEKSAELPDIFSDHKYPIRQFHRHQVGEYEIGKINPEANIGFCVTDISHGGLGLLAPEAKLRPYTNRNKQFQAVLNFLGTKAAFDLKIVYADNNLVGCQFINLNENQDNYLKGFLSYLDAGVCARGLDRSLLPEVFHGPQWASYGRADGSLEIHIQSATINRTHQVSVAYIVGKTKYYGILSPAKATIGGSDGHQLDEYEQREVLKTVIFILTGLHQHVRDAVLIQAINHGKNALFDQTLRNAS